MKTGFENQGSKTTLPIHDMEKRHHGLTPAVAGSYNEAARVSLSASHIPPQDFELTRDQLQSVAEVNWPPPDDRCELAWANRDDATRDGAYACAIAAVELTSGLYAVGRAERLTGADYYIAPLASHPQDLENCIRLEVSGTQSDEKEVLRRLGEKIRQARAGRSSLPAIAAVVGFKTKCIRMRTA